MLKTLHIEQFAIIDKSEIQFQQGFNVLSGETGAGKSILIDALGLALGERADASLIRPPHNKASVQAHFYPIPSALEQHLQANDLDDSDTPKQCLIRRHIRPNASKAFINDQAITSKTLKTISEQLISIHGQQVNQSLLKPSTQRQRLDRYADNDALLQQVKQSYHQIQDLQHALSQWQTQQQNQQERLNLLNYQLEEFDHIAPKNNEFTQLSATHASLSSADEILTQGQHLLNLIQNDHSDALAPTLRQIKQMLSKISQLDPRFEEAHELFQQSKIYLEESHDLIQKHLQKTEHDPQTLQQIDQRMSALHSLARKHHIHPDQLHPHWQTLKAQHQQLTQQNQQNDHLQQHLQDAQTHYQTLTKRLRQARQKASAPLAQEVQHWIRQLGMSQATFHITLTPSDTPSEHGQDDIQFLLCANLGQSPQPLQKVASGGELSRVSLAIEVACLDEAPVPTVIFDEIDAGIGGEVADTIGRLLKTLSATRQVICITHLPQVAVYADAHFLIDKTHHNGQTQTQVHRLENAQRIRELARMLGSADSPTSQQHARAMLKNAQNQRPD